MSAHSLLLIEDNPDDIELILGILAKLVPQDQIVHLNNGVDALDYLFCRGAYADRSPVEQPRLVLLDLVLPRLSGLEVLREIRSAQSTRLIPVVVLSSSTAQKDIRTAAQLGANSYITKPTDFSSLARGLKLLAHYWLALNIPPPCSAD